MSLTHSCYWQVDDSIEADLLQLNIGKCEGQCDRDGMARTEQGPRAHNENRSYWLCTCCAEEYHDYWDQMWADYYSGIL